MIIRAQATQAVNEGPCTCDTGGIRYRVPSLVNLQSIRSVSMPRLGHHHAGIVSIVILSFGNPSHLRTAFADARDHGSAAVIQFGQVAGQAAIRTGGVDATEKYAEQTVQAFGIVL